MPESINGEKKNQQGFIFQLLTIIKRAEGSANISLFEGKFVSLM